MPLPAMPRPRTALPVLLGAALGAGGFLQGTGGGPRASAAGETERLRAAREEIDMLRRENESLRSLAQGGGEVAVPRELVTRVEQDLGLTFLSSPVVHRIAGEELRDRVFAAVESRFGPSGADDRQEAFRHMGLLGESDELVSQIAAAKTVGARGWFDDISGEGWVTDSYRDNDIPDQAAMLRLLARILLHQHFPPPPAYPGDDAARAREALHQGAAAGAEARFLSANARAFGFVQVDRNSEAGRLFRTLAPFVQGLVTFPVTEGKGLADTFHVEGGDAFLGLFRDPPQTTLAVVRPDFPRGAPGPVVLPDFGEEPYLTDSAGMLGLRLWLAPDDALAGSWRNDRYALVPDGDATAALVWDIVMESPAAADSLEKLAGGRLAALRQTAGESRHIRVFRPAADRVRFVNAATMDFAEAMR